MVPYHSPKERKKLLAHKLHFLQCDKHQGQTSHPNE